MHLYVGLNFKRINAVSENGQAKLMVTSTYVCTSSSTTIIIQMFMYPYTLTLRDMFLYPRLILRENNLKVPHVLHYNVK